MCLFMMREMKLLYLRLFSIVCGEVDMFIVFIGVGKIFVGVIVVCIVRKWCFVLCILGKYVCKMDLI